jgi:hypothetical protein
MKSSLEIKQACSLFAFSRGFAFAFAEDILQPRKTEASGTMVFHKPYRFMSFNKVESTKRRTSS